MATAWVGGNYYITQSDMENNAQMFYAYMHRAGFTLEAIAGMLGNIQHESGVNPGIWENLIPYGRGYGLVQWTPYTKYSNWAGSGWENNGDKECERIAWEFDNGEQWSLTYAYSVDMTSQQFKVSRDTPENLAIAFLWNYENPYVSDAQAKLQKEQERSSAARTWYNYLLETVAYTPRLEMGDIYQSNYYTIWNAYWYEYRMPNCTAFAFGRWNELEDRRALHYDFPTGNGCDWFPQGQALGFETGRIPQLGAACCWWYVDTHGRPSGHVSIVEQINYDSQGNPVSFVTSNSAYYRSDPEDPNSDAGTPINDFPYFYLETISMDNLDYRYGHPEAYFQGFVYNQNIQPTPPTPPVPTHRKMPFIFYLKRPL